MSKKLSFILSLIFVSISISKVYDSQQHETVPGYPISLSPLINYESLSSDIGEDIPKINYFEVNPLIKEESLNFFREKYIFQVPPIEWTGNHEDCNKGTTSEAYKNTILDSINYYRAMAGVYSDITFDTEYNNKAQAAALMMSVNNQIDHNPDESWMCYSQEGYEGASDSNLVRDVKGKNPIDTYMGSVWHRRWIINPFTRKMGTGDIPEANGYMSANALYVVDSIYFDPDSEMREEFVAWPPNGYVPYPIVKPTWSFSVNNVDFSNASVTMLHNNKIISDLSILIADSNFIFWFPYEDPYIWFDPPPYDNKFTVMISNAAKDGQPINYEYDVIIFDPYERNYLPFVTYK